MTTFQITELRPGDVIVLSPEDSKSYGARNITIVENYQDFFFCHDDYGRKYGAILTNELHGYANRGQLLRPQPVRCESCGVFVGQQHGEYCKAWNNV